MTADEADAIRDACCRSKNAYSRATAYDLIRQYPTDKHGRTLRAYRCPFARFDQHPPHWHLGHVPSIPAVQRLAEAIRWYATGAPGTPKPKALT